jgi:hypothetical protein
MKVSALARVNASKVDLLASVGVPPLCGHQLYNLQALQKLHQTSLLQLGLSQYIDFGARYPRHDRVPPLWCIILTCASITAGVTYLNCFAFLYVVLMFYVLYSWFMDKHNTSSSTWCMCTKISPPLPAWLLCYCVVLGS